MEWIFYLVIIVILLTVVFRMGSLSSKLDEVLRLNRELQRNLRKPAAPETKKPPVPVVPDDEVFPLAAPKPPQEVAKEPPPPEAVYHAPEPEIRVKEVTPWPEKPREVAPFVPTAPREEKKKVPKEEAPSTILSRIWSWIVVGEEFRPQNVSLEYAVATTWLVRGGVLTLLAATAFFLHWAYERDLIRPEFRVGLTVLLGIGLALWGLLLFRGKYRTIGIGLVGAGFGALYFSVYSAQNLYHLCGEGTAIIFTFVITALAVVIAVWKNMLPVAVIGTLAGYAAPIIFSTGSKNYAGLYGYMLLLALGVGAVNFKRSWKILNLIAFVSTWGIFALSLWKYDSKDFPIVITFLGVYSFFFALLPLIYAAGHQRNISAFGVLGIAVNAFFTLSLGIPLVYDSFSWEASSVVPFGLALLLGTLFAAGRALDREDRGAETVYTVIAIGCLALGAGLSFGSAYITFTWALMALALLAAAGKMRYPKVLDVCGVCLFGIALIRFTGVDYLRYFMNTGEFAPMALERLMTLGVLTAVAGAVAYLFLRRDKIPLAQFFTVLAIAGIYWYGCFEIRLLFGSSYLISYHIIMALVLFGCGRNTRLGALPQICGGLIFIIAVLRFAFVLLNPGSYFWRDTLYTANLTERLLTLGVITLGSAAAWLIARKKKDDVAARLFGGIALGFFWFQGTYEVGFFLKQWNAQDAGVSVWWGVFALGLLLGGILRRKRYLRRIALALFAVTVGKIFLFDLAHLEQIYRIAASALLALALLAGAFIYIRFRDKFESEE